MNFTARVAEEVASIAHEDLRPALRERMRHVVLDWLGATIAGSVEESARIAHAYSLAEGGAPVSTLVATPHRVSAGLAALANGISCHALDYDDGSAWTDAHPSAAVVSAAVAVGERLDAGWADIVEAIVAGVQGEARIAQAVGRSAYEHGFHGTGVYGAFGAAGAAGRLLGLDAEGLQRAYGLAATQAAGLKASFGTMGKHLNAGGAAADGLLAAELAARGFTAPLDAVETKQGFAATHGTSWDPVRPARVMGDRLAVESILFKRHACCQGTHSAVEGILSLRAKRPFEPEDVAAVRLLVSESLPDVCGIAEPTTGLEGKFSVRYASSLALAARDTGPAAFTDEAVRDADMIALRNRIEVVPLADRQSSTPTTVIVELSGGEVLQGEVDVLELVRDEDLPAQWTALVSKFVGLVSPVLGADTARELVDRVGQLEATAPTDLLALTAPRAAAATR
jgi:2-methylcitrate dehydratase PrpD